MTKSTKQTNIYIYLILSHTLLQLKIPIDKENNPVFLIETVLVLKINETNHKQLIYKNKYVWIHKTKAEKKNKCQTLFLKIIEGQ